MLGRFFRSAEFLTSRVVLPPGHKLSPIERWKTEYYRRELQTLPAKIEAWGRSINYRLFPSNTPQQVQELVTGLQALVYRLDQLQEVGDGRQGDHQGVHQTAAITQEMDKDVRAWLIGIASIFGTWSEDPELESATLLRERLKALLTRLDKRIGEALEQTNTAAIGDRRQQGFYRLLAGARGLSEATVAYAGVADTIDWAQWHEEVFS